MIRQPALRPLSRHHHEALAIAQQLRRSNVDNMAHVQRAFLRFWRTHGRDHFRCEEEILLPAYAEYADPAHPLVMRVLREHMLIRRRAARMDQDAEGPLSALRQLGDEIADHVRLEERELFPLIEETLPADQLERLGSALAEAEAASD